MSTPSRLLGGAKARLAQTITEQAVRRVPVRLRYPDGREVGGGSASGPVLEIRNPEAMFQRLAEHPKIGLGEGYMSQEWTVAPGTDLADALTPFAKSLPSLFPRYLTRLRRVIDTAIPAATRNSLRAARRNIEAHYDLGNDFYRLWLDPSMTYSSALFEGAQDLSLAAAQRSKYRRILARLDVVATPQDMDVPGWFFHGLSGVKRENLVPRILSAVEAYVTVGEISNTLRKVWGEYRESITI